MRHQTTLLGFLFGAVCCLGVVLMMGADAPPTPEPADMRYSMIAFEGGLAAGFIDHSKQELLVYELDWTAVRSGGELRRKAVYDLTKIGEEFVSPTWIRRN